MEKGLGIAALVLSILAIFVPVVSIFVVILAMCLCAGAAFMGERPLAISSWVISAINLLFLSPFVWVGFATDRMQGKHSWILIVGTVLLVPLAAFLVRLTRRNDQSTARESSPPLPHGTGTLGVSSGGSNGPHAVVSTPVSFAAGSTSASGNYRDCPSCAETIRAEAKKCRYCGSAVEPVDVVEQSFCDEPSERAVAPGSQPLVASQPTASVTSVLSESVAAVVPVVTIDRAKPDLLVADVSLAAGAVPRTSSIGDSVSMRPAPTSFAPKWLYVFAVGVLVTTLSGYFAYVKHKSDADAKVAESERIRLEDLATEARQHAEAIRQDAAKREQELTRQVALEREKTAKALEANQAAASASAPVSTNAAAPAPDLKIGETWSYQTTEAGSGKKLSQFTYEVVNLTSKEIEIRSASATDFINGRPFRYTREWNLITFPQPNGAYREYSNPLQTFSFPLSVGKTWKGETLATNSVTKNQISFKMSGRVDGTEYVTTPAGKFSAYRIVVDQFSEPIAQKASASKAREVSWYAPSVGRIVRQERSSTQIDNGKTDSTVTELLAHARK